MARFATFFLMFALLVCSASLSARAELPQRFRLGLTIGTDEGTRERVEPFRRYMESVVDRPVDLFLFETLAETAAALSQSNIDYARLSPTAYAFLAKSCVGCVTPLVTSRPDSVTGRFHAVLIAMKGASAPGNPGQGLEDLRGGRIGIGPPDAVATHQLFLTHMRAQGRAPEQFFSRLDTVRTPLEGIAGLLAGTLDGVVGWSTMAGDPATGYSGGTLADFFRETNGSTSKLGIVWQSVALPYTAHVVRASLDEDLRQRLQSALIDLPQEAPDVYRAIEGDVFPGGFEPVSEEDYAGYLLLAE
ncbi:phosphate/phosphite/phosphonate ABC transporter substrate-binding protein [Roseibium sp.]|uniref:phosphate/phosphite/phosphonate ABC transporter substrate-binding protein n=1 Tax=Roseibium sp. TaxID=1936156 RepID=UPI003A9830FE